MASERACQSFPGRSVSLDVAMIDHNKDACPLNNLKA
jgi:hypothetical protein